VGESGELVLIEGYPRRRGWYLFLQRRRTGAKPLGVAAVLAQNPLKKPKKTKKSPAPAFHEQAQV
jgi:hypothetical protein